MDGRRSLGDSAAGSADRERRAAARLTVASPPAAVEELPAWEEMSTELRDAVAEMEKARKTRNEYYAAGKQGSKEWRKPHSKAGYGKLNVAATRATRLVKRLNPNAKPSVRYNTR